MKFIANFWAIAILIAMLAVRPAQPASAQDGEPPPPAPEVVDNLDLGLQPVEVRLDPVSSSFTQAPPAPRSVMAAQAASMLTSAFIIDYVPDAQVNALGDNCTTFPEAAKFAFQYSAGIWASQLNATVPIHIQACWSDMATGILGHSSAVSSLRNFPNAPVADTYYPISLANTLAGADLNGANPEMSIAYNSDYLTDFYYGTDYATPPNQINFATVVLHEITHGLGFSGSMVSSFGTGSWGNFGMPRIYDRFAVDQTGAQLINTGIYANPGPLLGSVLTGGNVYLNGANARAANAGANVKLFAPPQWMPGSSYAHLDFLTFYGTVNRLMVYSVAQGTTNYSPGPVTLGILTDIGWPYPPTDIALSSAVVMAELPVSTSVGVFSTADPNTPETFTYSLVAGGADNASFTISGSTLKTNTIFPGPGSKSIRVRVTDSGGLYYDKNFTITVIRFNHPPTNLALSANTIAENVPDGTFIGALSTTDPDAGEIFTYSLVNTALCPGPDNAAFTISGSSLLAGPWLNYELKPNPAICVRTTDLGGLAFDRTFTITLTDVNEPAAHIRLSSTILRIDASVGTDIGMLLADDPDAGDISDLYPHPCFWRHCAVHLRRQVCSVSPSR